MQKDRKLKRGFLGMNFPQNARARSSSAGVLGKDRVNVNPMGTEISMILGSPLPAKLPGSNPNRARMAWL